MTDEEMWEKFHALKYDQEYENYKLYPTECEWELGYTIFAKLCKTQGIFLIDESQPIELMGIPIRINYHRPDLIRLWREVK